MRNSLPTLPHSWSELTWQQLCQCWSVKMLYGGNPDVARVAALLSLCGLDSVQGTVLRTYTGETLYRLRGKDGRLWTVTAREIAYMAKETLPWFDYPYGDPGEKEVTDEKGKVVKEGREGVSGYVCPEWKDAMPLPVEELKIGRRRFSLPQVACNNITWQQYRSLQSIAPQLFQEGMSEEQTLTLQAQFMAYSLVPRSLALLDTMGGTVRLHPHWNYVYNATQAEGMVEFWQRELKQGVTTHRDNVITRLRDGAPSAAVLFHICFQVYQTALTYYAKSYPLLFADSGKEDPLRDALTGEVGTVNTIMKYAGYAEQQQVYDSNLPFVLDILNTMTKEAKEIERINSKIKK